MEPMARPSRYSPEVRERFVRMVQDQAGEHGSQWAAIAAIAPKAGRTTETLRRWVRQAERDAGHRPGLTTDERQRLKDLERENRELKRANEILKKASAYFAQAELDRRVKLRKRHSRGEHRRQIELTIMNDEPCCDRVRKQVQGSRLHFAGPIL